MSTAFAADAGRIDDLGKTLLKLQVRHIDGKTRASVRAQALNDLNTDIPDGECHLITNARCLTEGVDVPALDAVLFMEPRTSKIDIVQAVGRVMRQHVGKKRGYIVLPVIVPEGKRVTDSQFLRSSEFQPVWDVISALRAHDERMDVWVNTADIGGKPPITLLDKTQPSGEDESTGGSGNGDTDPIRDFIQMSLPLNEEIASALVDRCGDKRYWKSWGKDVAEVSNRITQPHRNPHQPSRPSRSPAGVRQVPRRDATDHQRNTSNPTNWYECSPRTLVTLPCSKPCSETPSSPTKTPSSKHSPK